MSSNDLFKSARLKIDWASQHIDNITDMLAQKRPFQYVVKTDAKAGWRSAYAKRDEAVIDELSLRCGDAVHNLRSAIDHAYTAVVLPFVEKPGQDKVVQFPMHERASGLEAVAKTRLAHKVSPEFFAAVVGLKGHGEPGGNALLYFIHALDTPDKHVRLIPVGYYLDVVVGNFRSKVPDFMPNLTPDSTVSVAQNARDFSWPCRPFSLNEWVQLGVPKNGMLEQEIDVAVDVCFQGRSDGRVMLTVPTLHQFVDVAKQVVSVISRFA